MYTNSLPHRKPRGPLNSPNAGSRDDLYVKGLGNWEGIEDARARASREVASPQTRVEQLLLGLRERYHVALGKVHPGARVNEKTTRNRIKTARILIQSVPLEAEEREDFLSVLAGLESDFQAIPKKSIRP